MYILIPAIYGALLAKKKWPEVKDIAVESADFLPWCLRSGSLESLVTLPSFTCG